MERLVYRSIAAPDLESAAIFEIVETSARKNPSREITGFLIHDEGRFHDGTGFGLFGSRRFEAGNLPALERAL